MSNPWCNPQNWYTDETLKKKSSYIPRNTIDDTSIIPGNYTYSLVDNLCFQQIPSLECNNLNIILSSGTIIGNVGLTFSCANLQANNVTIGRKNITCQHWEPDELCNWNISTLATVPGNENTFLNKVILNSLSSGFLDNTTVNQCYLQSSFLELNNSHLLGTENFRTYMSCTSGLIYNTSMDNEYIDFDGNFWISGNSILRGSGQGKFDFIGSKNYATLDGDIKFGNLSTNYGKVYGSSIYFSGGSVNTGIIIGDCIFSGTNTINYGTVSGTSIFINGAINSGIITESAIFYSGTYNYGQLKDYSLFNSAYNYGELIQGGKFIYSNNYGSIINGDVILISGVNYGNLVTSGNISFTSGSYNFGSLLSPLSQVSFELHSSHKEGTIYGLTTFGLGCTNEAVIQSGIFNSSSNNIGTIQHVGIFNNLSTNEGTTSSLPTGIFNGSSTNRGNLGTIGIFTNSSRNSYPIGSSATGVFYNTSSNDNTFHYALFYNNAFNLMSSKIIKTGIFYNSSYNFGSGNTLFFYDKSLNGSGSIVDSGIFLNRSINDRGATIQDLAYFSGSSINYSNNFLNPGHFTFNENAINSGHISNNSIILFSDSGVNKNYIKKGKFYHAAQNDTMGSGYDLSFFNQSINKGYVSNSGLFYNQSMNSNMGVLVNSNFYHESINNSSMRRPLVSGYEFLTSGNRTLTITDQAKNQGALDNVGATFNISGINEGYIQWIFNPFLIYTLSGIYNTGTSPYTYVSTATFLTTYNAASIPTIKFSGNSINRGDIAGYKLVSFGDSSVNYGSISTYPPVPKDSLSVTFAGGKNYGLIQNFAEFTNSAINYTTLSVASFDSAFNLGTVTDYALFDSHSLNNGTVGSGNFNASINNGRIGLGYFSNLSANHGMITSVGTFTNSTNTGTVLGDAIFDNSLSVKGVLGSNALFTNNSYCSNTIIYGSSVFTDGSCYDKDTTMIYGTITKETGCNPESNP